MDDEVTEPLDFPLLRRAFAATRDGVAIADMAGDDLPLIYVNSAFVSMTSNTSREVLASIAGSCETIGLTRLSPIRCAM